jgi:hypothetical protein
MADDFLSRLEYDPAAPDVESFMRHVRQHLRERGADENAMWADRHPGAAPALDSRTLDELRQAQAEVSNLQLAPGVAPSRTPFVGGLIDRLRLQFHRLVVYYVGRVADAQGRFNSRAVTAIEGLAAGAEQDDAAARIRRLEDQISGLEARLAALESGEAQGAAENKRG